MDSILKAYLVFFLVILNLAFLTTQFMDANPDPAYIAWRKWLTLECFLCAQILIMLFIFPSAGYLVWFLILLGLTLSGFQLTSLIPAIIRNRLCPILKRLLVVHVFLFFFFLVLSFLQIYLK